MVEEGKPRTDAHPPSDAGEDVERWTFVIDADGKVAKMMRKVKPAEHADDVPAALPLGAVPTSR